MSTPDHELSSMIQSAIDPSWIDRAACRDLTIEDLDMFFVDAGKGLAASAVQMCKSCPVRIDCLRHAYDRNITGGFFGGLSPTKRKQLTVDQAVELVSRDGPADR